MKEPVRGESKNSQENGAERCLHSGTMRQKRQKSIARVLQDADVSRTAANAEASS